MTAFLRRIALTTTLSVGASVAMTAIGCRLAGAPFSGVPLVMCVLCPLLICPPISLFFFRQGARMARLYADLEVAHAALKAATARVEEASRRDGLTGLLNRTAFFERMDAESRRAGGSMLMIDADRFKQINDTFGHSSGDAALLAVARAIEGLAGVDAIVGRIGGEEFAVFLPGAGHARAAALADAVRGLVEARDVEGPAGPFRLTVSIGVASAEAGVGAPQIYDAADEALYGAKRAGRNRAVSYDGGVAA